MTLENPRTALAASVIVPARNAGSDLRRLVDALVDQTIPHDRFEVIIGDDESSDGSTAALSSKWPGWVRVSSGARLNSYGARNRAARHARGTILAFCDADCTPHPAWLEVGIDALADADLAGGNVVPVPPARPTVWTLLDVDLHVDQELAVRRGRALGGNLFVHREVFERGRGFDESLPNGGDFDFASRCVESGARLAYAPHAVVHHPTHDRAAPLLRKIWRINRAAAARAARAGTRRRILSPALIPIVGMARSRRLVGRPLRLDRRRLAMAGIRPRFATELCALAVMYLFLPYFAYSARTVGWRQGRRSQ